MGYETLLQQIKAVCTWNSLCLSVQSEYMPKFMVFHDQQTFTNQMRIFQYNIRAT